MAPMESLKCSREVHSELMKESFPMVQNGVSEGLGTFGSHEGQGGSARNSNDMPVHLTIATQKEAFKRPIGGGGKNLEKIKNESRAHIDVEGQTSFKIDWNDCPFADYRKAGANQHATIFRGIEDDIAATLKVSVEIACWYECCNR